MKLSCFVKEILLKGDISNKLICPETICFDEFRAFVLDKPIRNNHLAFSEKQVRFPKGHFHKKEKTAMALNAFANHELLAVEIMAYALMIFPHNTDESIKFKRGILKSLKDEQKHFQLYANRMSELGFEFGDFPLNDFFWRHMSPMKTEAEYLSMMALTFEAANLDFSFHYEKIFRDLGDIKTADILREVYLDEISHVSFGVHYLNLWRKDKTLWDYYSEVLPFPLTPARSKGKKLIKESRIKAKMDEEFIENLLAYKNDFNVLERKEWK